MRALRTTALATVLALAVGTGGLMPAALAQTPPDPQSKTDVQHRPQPHAPAAHNRRPGDAAGNRFGAGRGAGMLELACSDRGAKGIEVMLVRLSHRLQLTDQQQPLFDTLKAEALTAQQDFAAACTAARGDVAPTTGNKGTAAQPSPSTSTDSDAPGNPDLVARLRMQLAIESARVEALQSVLPSLQAFYDSLTDTQKSSLMPQRQGRPGGFGARRPNPQAPQPEQSPAPVTPSQT